MTIHQELQKEAVGVLIELYTFDLTAYGGPLFYLTPNSRNSASISFGGQEYMAFPIQGSNFETNTDGKQPQPTLVLGNVTQFIQNYLTDYNDCVGATVTRVLTLEKYCDHGDTPDPTQTFGSQLYKVFQLSTQEKNFIEFKLASLIDRPGRKFPPEQVLRKEFPGAGLFRKE